MKKYLLLVGNREEQFFYNIKNTEKIQVFTMYKPLSKIQRLIRKKFRNSILINKHFYCDWRRLEDSFDCIILEDCAVDNAIFKYLKKHFSKAEIVYWFRNSLDAVDYTVARNRNLMHAGMCDRVLSFDKNNCEKYGFEYIENCYALDPSIKLESLKYDMIFLGTDKSRYDLLLSIIKKTEHMGWNNFIQIYSYSRDENKYITHQFMQYKEYLKKLAQSRVVLDVIDDSYQNGYSLRVFESLFYRKKLITNQMMIKNEPFYNPNNIYVFNPKDLTSLNNLDAFLEIPYQNVSNEKLALYDFEYWIKRI